ncbi:MAG: hypothetical protein HW412_972 [Bacteroidetes bacterium]|nr:hypothetical protein [Bacteroidota bacterium]
MRDLHKLSVEIFLQLVSKNFEVARANASVQPSRKDELGMYLREQWYLLHPKPELLNDPDPIGRLDVSILQNHLLGPLLGVDDPRTSNRIEFVGGIRGVTELERKVNSREMAVAFSLYPTSIDELFAIADAGKIMPPKSTWFEPKLRDGIVVHMLE